MDRFFVGSLFIFLFRFLLEYFVIDKFKIEVRLVAKYPKRKRRIVAWINAIAYFIAYLLSVALILLLSYLLEKKLGLSSDFLLW